MKIAGDRSSSFFRLHSECSSAPHFLAAFSHVIFLVKWQRTHVLLNQQKFVMPFSVQFSQAGERLAAWQYERAIDQATVRPCQEYDSVSGPRNFPAVAARDFSAVKLGQPSRGFHMNENNRMKNHVSSSLRIICATCQIFVKALLSKRRTTQQGRDILNSHPF